MPNWRREGMKHGWIEFQTPSRIGYSFTPLFSDWCFALVSIHWSRNRSLGLVRIRMYLGAFGLCFSFRAKAAVVRKCRRRFHFDDEKKKLLLQYIKFKSELSSDPAIPDRPQTNFTAVLRALGPFRNSLIEPLVVFIQFVSLRTLFTFSLTRFCNSLF